MTIRPGVTIQPTRDEDHDAIDAIITAAFGQADEARLVRTLRAQGAAVLELTALAGEAPIGHVMFSRAWIDGDGARAAALQMAPVSVAPSAQAKGVGGALIREGLEQLRKRGESHVFVLGHGAYYPRFGFSAAAAKPFDAPWNGPAHMLARLSASGPERGVVLAAPAFFA